MPSHLVRNRLSERLCQYSEERPPISYCEQLPIFNRSILCFERRPDRRNPQYSAKRFGVNPHSDTPWPKCSVVQLQGLEFQALQNTSALEAAPPIYSGRSSLELRDAARIREGEFAEEVEVPRALTPYEHICKVWTTRPNRFRLNLLHHTVGLNTYNTNVKTARCGRR